MKISQQTSKDLVYENISCNLCGNNDYTIVYPKLNVFQEVPLTSKYSAAKGVMCTDQIVKCKNCSLVYINPRPKASMIIDACSEGNDEVYVSQPEGRLQTFKRGLKFIEKYQKSGKILDVGCAAGFFLKIAKDNGWNVVGVEPNSWLCEYGNHLYNMKNIPATLERAKFEDSSFDVSTLWDVLEHVPDPCSTLKEINRVTKLGGYIVVSYPNFGSVLAKISGRKWWFLLSHHLYYFTPKTLKNLLAKEGFKIIDSRKHWQVLGIGYMVTMFRKLNEDSFVGKLASIAEKFFRISRLYNVKIWYYASQEDVIAKKIKNT